MSIAVAVAAGLGVVGAAIVLSRVRADRLAFFMVEALVLVIGWNGLRAAGGAANNGFLVLSLLLVIFCAYNEKRTIPIPVWLLATAALMIVAWLLVVAFPPSLGLQNRTDLQFNQLFVAAGVPIKILGGNRSDAAALIKWEIALVILPVVIAFVAHTPQRIGRLLDIWTVSATINAFCGIADYAGIHSLAAKPIMGNRSSGLTVAPNYLSLTCLLAMPTALRWVGRGRRQTLAAIGAMLLLTGGEYVSGSRDGAATVPVAIVLCFAFLPKLRPALRYVLPVLVAGGVGVLAFTHAGRSILNQLRLGGGPSASTAGSDYQRTVFRRVAEAQISARPIAGFGYQVDNDAQNIYLQILASGGIIAMGAFVIFIGGLARCVTRSLRGPVNEDARALGICIAIWLINGYYNAQIADKYLYVLPGIMIACARVSMRMRTQTARAPSTETEDLAPVVAAAPPALAPVGAAQ